MAATWRSEESPQRLHTHRSGGLQLATAWRSTHQRPSFPHTVRELLSSCPVVVLGGECLSPLSASVQRKLLKCFVYMARMVSFNSAFSGSCGVTVEPLLKLKLGRNNFSTRGVSQDSWGSVKKN